MCDSAGNGESGGVAGAGQDSEADNEPPQQAPPLPEGDCVEVGETLEEGAPKSAKRPRLNEEDQGLEQVDMPAEMHTGTPAQSNASFLFSEKGGVVLKFRICLKTNSSFLSIICTNFRFIPGGVGKKRSAPTI